MSDIKHQMYLQESFYKIKKSIDSCITIKQLENITPFAVENFYQCQRVGLYHNLLDLLIDKGKVIILKNTLKKIENER